MSYFLLSIALICYYKTYKLFLIRIESAARFCRQVAAWFQDMFFNFYLVKSHKIFNN